MEELSSTVLAEPEKFAKMLADQQEFSIKLFDAIQIDMERYLERFSRESMAMKNIHHIHEPTSISIRQVIALINPDGIESGEIEFF